MTASELSKTKQKSTTLIHNKIKKIQKKIKIYPSSTALATSVASARVGRGFLIIESSIWVAVMTGLPAKLLFKDRILTRSYYLLILILLFWKKIKKKKIPFANHHFLSSRNVFDRNFRAEIATSNHHTVGDSKNLIKVIQTFLKRGENFFCQRKKIQIKHAK